MRFLFVLALAAGACRAGPTESGQTAAARDLAAQLNFEAGQKGGRPAGWGGGPKETIFADGRVTHSGKWAVRIERGAGSPGTFSSLTKSLPIDFKGRIIELRGFVRTEDVSEFAGLWMREDGAETTLEFDNMQSRQLKGTTGWSEYAITLPLNSEARSLYFGFLVGGTGKAWADDLQLLVDGKPIWEAPKAERVETAVDRDHEFDGGSKIALAGITPVQAANLSTLCKVWGFLKYHHPAVTSGQRSWDYELFRIIPAVLVAGDRAAADAVLLKWIDGLGETKSGGAMAVLDEGADFYLHPDLRWLKVDEFLGKELGARLQQSYAHRPATGEQYFVSMVDGVGNPQFTRERGYPKIQFPDPGYQLLGLFRFWNIIVYWSPYRDLLEDDWDAVLAEFIPRIGLAKDRDAYQLELMALIAKVHDTHANLWSSLDVRPPAGDSQLPVTVRFVEGRAVVTKILLPSGKTAGGLQVGDVIMAIDGIPVAKLIADWTPYYAASNETTRLRDIAGALTRGAAGEVKVRQQRGPDESVVSIPRVAVASLEGQDAHFHDLPGPTFRLLSKEVAYLKLSSVKAAEAASYVERAAGTKGMIIDLRNYPSEFVVFALGSHLVGKLTEFVRFTVGDPANPGAFTFTPPLALTPQSPSYSGKIVILIDETTQSQAEYTTMAFRVAPGAKVVGSTTAGADGNVSAIPLPGGLRTMISGIGIFYPDKRPTQRVGIIPDVEARPTIAGIRAGRDEVLEVGLRQILGPEISAEEIERLALAPD